MTETEETVSMADFASKMNEHYSLENQQKRIDSYIAIVDSNLRGNILDKKTSLDMKNAMGYLDILDQESYLDSRHQFLAQKHKLKLNVKYSFGGINYTW